MSGNIVHKGYNTFRVNDALLAKVVEAIKKGESDARRSGQVRSFEIYYDGHRSRMVFGQIIIVPAKVADSKEDFPAALLYGAMVRELRGEDLADIYSYKLGESEFDEYDDKYLKAIKERLFKDDAGTLRSIVIFIPTWTNVRDYVLFKYSRDYEALHRMVRQQIFGAYYNPALSTAFEQLASDTDNLNVSEITPKELYPGLAEGLAKNQPELQDGSVAVRPKKQDVYFPELEPGDKEGKTASARKPIMLLAKETVGEINEEFLEPAEKAILDTLAGDLIAKVNGEVSDPDEVAKKSALNIAEAASDAPAPAGPRVACNRATKKAATPITNAQIKQAAVGDTCSGCGQKLNPLTQTLHDYAQEVGGADKLPDVMYVNTHLGEVSLTRPDHYNCLYVTKADALRILNKQHSHSQAASVEGKRGSTDDSGATTGLRHQPDYGESDSHCAEQNAAAEAQAVLEKKGAVQPLQPVKEITAPGDTTEYCQRGPRARCNDVDPQLCAGGGYDAACDCPDCHKTHPHIDFINQRFNHVSSKTALEVQGHKLVTVGQKFAAVSAGGYIEELRMNGTKVKWARPNQFTVAFRRGVEVYVRNPQNRKQADVPQTFEEIWSNIAEPMGPAPSVDLKEDGGSPVQTETAPSSTPHSTSKLDRLHQRNSTDDESGAEREHDSSPDNRGSEAESKEEPKAEEKKPWEKEASTQKAKCPECGVVVRCYKGDEDTADARDFRFTSHDVDGKECKGTNSKAKVAHTPRGSQCPNCHKELDPFGICPDASVEENRLTTKGPDHKSYCDGKHASLGKCASCAKPVTAAEGSEVAPDVYWHRACQETAKRAAFDMFMPGQVCKEFYPELLKETVEYPSEGNTSPNNYVSSDALPKGGENAIMTGPSAAMGLGRDGKSQVLEGAPLRMENDVRGYPFEREYYAQTEGVSPQAFCAALGLTTLKKNASNEEFVAQFADFLKKAMGEVAAAFIAAFKLTSRPLMSKVPGTGSLHLDFLEAANTPLPPGSVNVASRIRYLVTKLTDSQFREALDGAWAQAAVWNEDPNGGYTYEVFVRPESIDKDNLVLTYSYVAGTKGL